MAAGPRIWGRVFTAPGQWTWVMVTADANGFLDEFYLVALIQCILLNLGESPFWSNFGIPAQGSVIQQVPPDIYVAQTQRYFSQFFASLVISREPGPTPTYLVKVVTNQGATLSVTIPGNDLYSLVNP
jgi:hypothetical protein